MCPGKQYGPIPLQPAVGVAGAGYALYPDALVRVVSSAGDLERLVHITALGFLLFLLAYLRQGRHRGDDEHRQECRQQHQLPHRFPLRVVVSSWSSDPSPRLAFAEVRSRTDRAS